MDEDNLKTSLIVAENKSEDESSSIGSEDVTTKLTQLIMSILHQL